jgi:putative DNA primase/helicase
MPSLARFRGVLRALLDRPVPINDDGSLSPPSLSLSSEAHAQWVAFYNAIEVELRPGGEARDVRDVASKSADNAARLAALFHVYQGGAGPIDGDSMASGCRLAAWHLTEARRFFGELALPRSIANAVRLDEWLIERAKAVGVRSIPTGDVLRLGPPGTRDRDDLTEALRELIELNRARERTAGKRRLIDVNPALLREGEDDGC